MTLSQSTLETEFRKIIDPDFASFGGFPGSISEAQSRWATAYDTYASAATDISGDSVASKNKPGFQSALAFLQNNSYAQAAADFRTAVETYWTGATFAVGALVAGTGSPCPNVGGNSIFGTETTSLVTAILSGVMATFQTGLVSEFTSVSDNGAAKAAALAALFHTATTTGFQVLITGLDTTPPGSGGPLPITNTCTIF